MAGQTHKTIETFRQKCRDAGYRITPQRTQILRRVLQAGGHPDAESIFRTVHSEFPSISPDTVYRTLELLEDMGFISRVNILSGRSRFDPRPEPHHHFICTKCDAVMDFDSDEYDSVSPPETVDTLGRIKSIRVEVRGLCNRCLDQQDADNSGQ